MTNQSMLGWVRRDRAAVLLCLLFAHGGGLSPTRIVATMGNLGLLSTVAVGSDLRIAASAFPAGVASLTKHLSPYGGGEMYPLMFKDTFHLASASIFIRSSANCPASASPNLVTSTAEPWYGLSAATNAEYSFGLTRRQASRCWSSNKSCSAFAALSRCWAASNSILL